ncbi:MAG: ATP-binding protein [Gemmatimonadota bacterium]
MRVRVTSAPPTHGVGVRFRLVQTLVLALFLTGAAVSAVVAATPTNESRLVLGLLMGLALALFLGLLIGREVIQPLRSLETHLAALQRGDLDARIRDGSRIREIQDLVTACNRLTGELEARFRERTRERDEMQVLIDSMAEGVIALTEDARILHLNRAARELLQLPHATAFAPVGSLVRPPELRSLLERAVVQEEVSREVEFGGRHLLAASRALDGGGAVVTVMDVSETRRLEQVRRDFVANASHELKTPLTSIRGFAETLLEGDPPEALRQQFLAAIRNNTVRLQRLVDDLLDLSRMESGRWEPRAEPISLARAAMSVWEDLAPRADEKDLHFSVEGDVEIQADPQALDQILRNLLENSVRHTDRGGHVRVSASFRDDGMVNVEVVDDGEGIPSKALPRIFERFFRADGSRARDAGGTGLGLSIVRHLVLAMGGTVEAESELGRGTTIRFTLPGEG